MRIVRKKARFHCRWIAGGFVLAGDTLSGIFVRHLHAAFRHGCGGQDIRATGDYRP
jgi:hypothetical protein